MIPGPQMIPDRKRSPNWLKTTLFPFGLCQHVPTGHNSDINISSFYAYAYTHGHARLHIGPQMHDPEETIRNGMDGGIVWIGNWRS